MNTAILKFWSNEAEMIDVSNVIRNEAVRAETRNDEDDAEKPIVPCSDMSSESTHGGTEATESLNVESSMGSRDSCGESVDVNVNDEDGSERDELDGDEAEADGVKDRAGRKNADVFVDLDRGVAFKRIHSAFEKLFEAFGGEVIDHVPGTSLLSARELVRRVANKRLIWSCYVDEVRAGVVVLLDTSGSMSESEEILAVAKRVAEQLRNVQVFETPNGGVPRERENDAKYIERYKRALDSAEIVIYVGDFDGANTPIELCLNGKRVVWICPEYNRYSEIDEHDWVSYTQTDLLRLIRAGTMFYYKFSDPEYFTNVYLVNEYEAAIRKALAWKPY